jgi:uncharacterized membrane protein SpoIIM required for sporulation
LTNTQLYIGKMLAAIVPPMAASYMGIAVYLVGLLLSIGWVVPFALLLQILFLSTIQGVVMVAAAVVVSSQTTSVRAANLLASFIIVPTAFLVQFEAVVMFWGNNRGLWWLILALAVTAVVLVRMGVKIFNREELLGRDIDQIRLGWMVRVVWARFTGRQSDGRYPALLAWYRQLFAWLPALKGAVVALTLAWLGALLLGAILAGVYRLPPALREELGGADLAGNLSALELLLGRLPLYIFLHNVRAVAVATLLGVFTCGVLGVLIFMLPWALVSYIAVQLAMVGGSATAFVLGAIAPHATLELPALLLAAAAGLRWHLTIVAPPPDRTVSESWLLAAADFGRVLVGLVVPLLLAAAFVEAFVTPQVIYRVYGG